MNEFRARISRVRMKGGADVHVLAEQRDWRGTIVEHARAIAEGGPLACYFVLGIHRDGSHNCGFRIDDETSVIPRTLLPAYIEEIARRYAVTKAQAGETFAELFERT